MEITTLTQQLGDARRAEMLAAAERRRALGRRRPRIRRHRAAWTAVQVLR